jgi:hypothetical protein
LAGAIEMRNKAAMPIVDGVGCPKRHDVVGQGGFRLAAYGVELRGIRRHRAAGGSIRAAHPPAPTGRSMDSDSSAQSQLADLPAQTFAAAHGSSVPSIDTGAQRGAYMVQAETSRNLSGSFAM